MSKRDDVWLCPFMVLCDSQEKAPFTFHGIRADSDHDYRPILIQPQWTYLGAGMGDYSIKGYEPSRKDNPSNPRVSVERKSIEDCIGTVLGFASRRERFKNELEQLAEMESACVVVEGTMGAVLAAVQQEGEKTREQNMKTLYRSWIAFTQEYRVPWWFCDDRRMAEITTFRWLERFWRKQREAEKAAAKEMASAS
jgi:DNA excision repair protein ERCC-4